MESADKIWLLNFFIFSSQSDKPQQFKQEKNVIEKKPWTTYKMPKNAS